MTKIVHNSILASCVTVWVKWKDVRKRERGILCLEDRNEREREREWERDGSIGPLGHKPKWDNAFLPSFIPYSIFYQTRNRNLQVSVSVKFRRHRRRRRLERKSFACLLRSSEQKLLRAKFVLIFFLLCASRRRRLLWIIPHSFISQRNKSGKASVTGRYFFLSRQKLSSG